MVIWLATYGLAAAGGKWGFKRWLKIGAGCDRGPVSNCPGDAPERHDVGLQFLRFSLQCCS